MRRKWNRWFSSLILMVLLLLLLPIVPYFVKDDAPAQPMQPASQTENRNEQMHKLAALEKDLQITSQLSQHALLASMEQLLAMSGKEEAIIKQELQQLGEQHSNVCSLQLIDLHGTIGYGSIPASQNNEHQQFYEEAVKEVRLGNRYESAIFSDADNRRYHIIGLPDTAEVERGIIAVVRQDFLHQVEIQQKKNLRLIPYPPEKPDRIASVKANSMEDMVVLTGEDNGHASHYYMQEAVVRFRQVPSEEELAQIKKAIHAESHKRLGDTFVFQSKQLDSEQLIAYFQKEWDTIYVEPHYLYLTNEEDPIIPNDLLYAQYQWNLPSIAAEEAWTVGKGSEQVTIAVLDTGVQSDHPDLAGRLLPGANFVNENAKPDDDVGHGTHVTGIIGANINNSQGVAGISWYNQIMPLKVLGNNGVGSAYSVAKGIIWATDNGAKVINMSLGNYAETSFLHDAVKYAYERDVVLVAASGNDNTNRPSYPAAYPEVLAVAATDTNKKRASFSNYGAYVAISAPGDSIASTYPGGQYAALSGTSMASPHVAALAGLIRSANPALTNKEVVEIICKTATDLGAAGRDEYYGFGEINMNAALRAASNQTAASTVAEPSFLEKLIRSLTRRR